MHIRESDPLEIFTEKDGSIILKKYSPIGEMDEIGYEDYVYGEGVCLIEWANLIEEILPDHYQKITIRKDLEKGFDYREIEMEEQ